MFPLALVPTSLELLKSALGFGLQELNLIHQRKAGLWLPRMLVHSLVLQMQPEGSGEQALVGRSNLPCSECYNSMCHHPYIGRYTLSNLMMCP